MTDSLTAPPVAPASPPVPDFTQRLRTALGVPNAPLVLLGNFEVEEQWAAGEHTLPRFSADSGTAVVNRMDEFALLLGRPGDHVVLKTLPDPAYLDYLTDLGVGLPQLHVAADQRFERTVTADVLGDPALLDRLSALGASGARLLPHGTSPLEELLARRTGLPLATPDAALCKAVNSKVYSRGLADQLGLPQPAGWTCETLPELAAALEDAKGLLARGRRAVVKEAYGVSGKGLVVLDGERRTDRVLKMLSAKVERSGRPDIAFVVEEWVENHGDLNYQFTVGRDGSVHFDFVKRALTEGGVHKGHRFPAELTSDQLALITRAAALLGARLAADGYYGVVGVDAILTADGGVHPVIEINARNNMSTYQTRLQEAFVGPGRAALARYYPVRLDGRLGFERLRELLGDLLLTDPAGSGLLVNNFATVNAGLDVRPGEPFDGRLYGIVVAGSAAELDDLDERLAARIRVLGAAHVR
ncbi:preATP grasp domain-containing protein [Kitasatospora sp. NPDC054795]